MSLLQRERIYRNVSTAEVLIFTIQRVARMRGLIEMCHHQFRETGLTWIDGEPLYECLYCHGLYTERGKDEAISSC